MKDDSVTVRDRDSTKQVRVKIKDLADIIWKLIFEKTGKIVKP